MEEKENLKDRERGLRDCVVSNDLTTGNIRSKLMKFFFPIMAGMMFQQLYSAVDAMIVGRYLGPTALAAVGGGASVITEAVIGFFMGLNCGASVIVSQHFGAGNDRGLSRVLHTFISFCLIIGIAISCILFILAPSMLRMINTPDDIMRDSVTYLRIYFSGSIALLLYNLFQGTLQGVGDSKRPLKYMITSCILNIILDYLFVGVFGWGVAGAACASVVSMTACAGMALIYLLRIEGPHKIRLNMLCLDTNVLKRTLKIGLPSGLECCVYAVSNLIIQANVNGFGTKVAAAWAATSKLDGFYWVVTNSFSIAICSFVGQCYGAGKYDRMRKSVRCCMKISLITTVVLSAVLLLSSRWAYSMFITDPEVVDYAVKLMLCFVPFYFIWSYIDVMTGAFRGTGDTMRPMVITFVGTCLFRVFWIYVIVPIHSSIYTVGIVYSVSWLITASAFTVYYLRKSKLRMKTYSDISEQIDD